MLAARAEAFRLRMFSICFILRESVTGGVGEGRRNGGIAGERSRRPSNGERFRGDAAAKGNGGTGSAPLRGLPTVKKARITVDRSRERGTG